MPTKEDKPLKVKNRILNNNQNLNRSLKKNNLTTKKK